MVGGRRGRAGDHLTDEPDPLADLNKLLIDPSEALSMEAHGRTEAAVLVPIYGWPDDPGLIFTERRHDLRRHAGEISFPGGRRDPGEELLDTALREAQEEIALPPEAVRLAGALPPIGTFVTSYKVHPYVGMVDRDLELTPSPDEVQSILSVSFGELRDGYAMRRLVRLGVPIRTETYEVGGKLIWGATARILALLFERLGRP